jgi:hypothetical protein
LFSDRKRSRALWREAKRFAETRPASEGQTNRDEIERKKPGEKSPGFLFSQCFARKIHREFRGTIGARAYTGADRERLRIEDGEWPR